MGWAALRRHLTLLRSFPAGAYLLLFAIVAIAGSYDLYASVRERFVLKTESLTVTQEEEVARISLQKGLELKTPEGITIKGVSGEIILKRPKLDGGTESFKFRRSNLKSLSISGNVRVTSEKLNASFSTLTSTDGGQTWQGRGRVTLDYKTKARSRSASNIDIGKRVTLKSSDIQLNTKTGEISIFGNFNLTSDGGALRALGKGLNGNIQTSEFTISKTASIRYQDVQLSSDRMKISNREQRIIASGNAKLVQAGRTVKAKEIEILLREGGYRMKIAGQERIELPQ